MRRGGTSPAAAPSPRTTIASGRGNQRPAALLVFAAAVLVYANTFTAGYTLDDVPVIRDNPLIQDLSRAGELFRTHYWSANDWVADKGLYRPLTLLSFALNHAVHGASPAGYHVVNVLLHALASVLAFRLCADLTGRTGTALAAGLIFAVHPIHTEAVSGLVGRAEVLALLGIMASWLCWTRAMAASSRGRAAAWGAACAAGFLGGALAKETGVIAPALILLGEALLPSRRSLVRLRPRAVCVFGLLLAAGAVYLALRHSAVGSRGIHPGWAGVEPAHRVWTAIRVIGEYAGLLFVPVGLLAEYGVHDVPIARSPREAGVVGGMAVVCAVMVAFFYLRRRQPAAAWGLGLFAISLLPISNLFFAIGVMKAERLLYAPSLGWTLAVVAVLALPAHTWWRTIGAPVVLAAALLLMSLQTVVRNRDWQNNYTLALATQHVSPNSPVFNTNLAIWYRESKAWDEAREAALRALAAEPRNWRTLSLLGEIELDAGRPSEARAFFDRAVVEKPDHPPLLILWARACFESQDWSSAAAALERLAGLQPDEPAVTINLLGVYLRLGRFDDALRAANAAEARFPRHADVLTQVGSVFEALNMRERADEAYRRARQARR